ncbi:hypothetical protein KXD93_29620 [Mucilaginibacter sp. BJC16-A38]|uniref:S41 family peptidase n=1 Tax=Mucilaginibacter phenanthrenivorans TaxID=1234842 RepID=UPI002158898C|nr:S41 family peptidase [Mucilaginibacter phenanthrenivorans]MCR8561851.1 hypothetical protein [Mucilaginibacter phenanthrenivorans]
MKYLITFLLLSFIFSVELATASAIDTVPKEKQYSKKELSDDVSYLVHSITDVHPNMYHSITPNQYKKLTDSVLANLHDGMTAKQAWPLIGRLIGALNEGHSSLNFPENLTATLKAGRNILFPVLISEFDGQYFIVRADGSAEDVLLTGDKIISINGISSSRLVDLLSSNTGGLKLWRSNDICRNMIPYLEMYNIHGPYHITYTRGGKLDSTSLKAVSFPDYVGHLKAKAGKLPKAPVTADLAFNYLEGNKAYLGINSLTADTAKFKHFLDSVFTSIKQTKPASLIIDLRRNGGGNSALGAMLLGYITDRPFRMTGGVKWKVSQEYKDELNKRSNGDAAKQMDYYFSKANGSVLEDDGVAPQKPAKNDLFYKGKVIVLIGSRTFSSANMLANTIQDYKLATLVGEPSGEPANDYGELITIKLPNTGFTFTTSVKQFVRANGDAKDPHPVLPAYTIHGAPLTPADEVLEFAKKL